MMTAWFSICRLVKQTKQTWFDLHAAALLLAWNTGTWSGLRWKCCWLSFCTPVWNDTVCPRNSLWPYTGTYHHSDGVGWWGWARGVVVVRRSGHGKPGEHRRGPRHLSAVCCFSHVVLSVRSVLKTRTPRFTQGTIAPVVCVATLWGVTFFCWEWIKRAQLGCDSEVFVFLLPGSLRRRNQPQLEMKSFAEDESWFPSEKQSESWFTSKRAALPKFPCAAAFTALACNCASLRECLISFCNRYKGIYWDSVVFWADRCSTFVVYELVLRNPLTWVSTISSRAWYSEWRRKKDLILKWRRETLITYAVSVTSKHFDVMMVVSSDRFLPFCFCDCWLRLAYIRTLLLADVYLFDLLSAFVKWRISSWS